ncbi:uncharacterized protein B0I36DRAFT_378521 [Microdochium trichocladiopsis]|uniref:Uncharacterized protein n=1 Tax=Microdochium trichocladiopsis TaxID=1682393 RepID=A0A9P8XS82_9PEZI|nr:uncharacterized protein B0I36DRAFT_378521 [Microdochium trichocladiopsis]KAH7010896.1 hypothetical protein B0I36DRAFT_378521 [Microdochium trichocladiopsis]
MFRFHKTLDIITLFHKAGNLASTPPRLPRRARTREEFKLNITEEPPTEDQLRTILGYVGQSKVSSVVKGASLDNDAIKKFRSSTNAFQRPVNNSKAVTSAEGSQILKLLEQPKGQSA